MSFPKFFFFLFSFFIPLTTYAQKLPSSQPTHTTKRYIVQIDQLGFPRCPDSSLHSFRQVTLFQLIQHLQKLPKHSQLTLQIDPSAPYKKVLVITSIIKGLQHTFSTTFTSIPHPKLTIKRKKNIPSTSQKIEKKKILSILWNKIPIASQKNPHKKRMFELRAKIVNLPSSTQIPTALVEYKEQRYLPLARIYSDKKGFFRYNILWDPTRHYRLALIFNKKFIQYPIPTSQVKNGLLYLKLSLPSSTKITSSKFAQTKKRTSTKPSLRKRRPAKNKNSAAQIPTTQRIIPPDKKDWKSAPLAQNEAKKLKNYTELRITLLDHKGQPAQKMATGLMQLNGSKQIPVGRVTSDIYGRLRYRIDPKKGRSLSLITVMGVLLHKEKILLKKNHAKIVYRTFKLPNRRQYHSVFEEFHLIVEPLVDKPNAVKVTAFAFLLNGMTNKGEKIPDLLLPLPAGVKEIYLDKKLAELNTKKDPKFIRILSKLPPGRAKFSYSFSLPLHLKSSKLHLDFPYPIERMSVLFHPSLRPLKNAQSLEVVKISRTENAPPQKFFALFFKPRLDASSLDLSIRQLYALHSQNALLQWIQSSKNNPNQRKKLLGLLVIIALIFAGLLLLLLSPQSPSKNPSSSSLKG